VTPLNLTHSKIDAVLALTNRNGFVDLSLEVVPRLQRGETVVASESPVLFEYPSDETNMLNFSVEALNTVL
jgi:hypothetical protein